MNLLNNHSVARSFTQRLKDGAKVWTRMNVDILNHRNTMVEAWVSGYFRGGIAKTHTMNLMDRAIGILVPYLSMSNPKINCEARIVELKPWAYTTELAINHLLNEIKFSKTVLRPVIFNSMFGAGITKTGMMKEYESNVYGNHLEVGQPYSAVVDDEDYIGDVSANTREDFEMEGNYYVMPTEQAKEFFGAKHADHIQPSFKLHGQRSITEVVKSSMRGTDYHTLKYWTRFMDIYLPDEKVTITLLADDTYTKKLREVEYDGPEDGPYDFLGYKFAPKQPMPIPPAWGWVDMDTALNVLVNKMRNQAERERSVLVYSGEVEDDAENVRNAIDGSTVKVDDISQIKEINLGGTNPENYQWVSYIESQFSIQGGNLYQLGGRGSQANTLGQEQMLMTNASRIVDDMEQAVYDMAQSIIKKLCWYVWTDPLIQIPVTKRMPGAGGIDVLFDNYAQEGDFYDFNFKIQPYSMQRFSPTLQHQKLMEFLSGWVLPVTQFAAQQGNRLNIDATTRKIAEYMQLDIEDIWESAIPPDGGAVGLGPYQPTTGTMAQKQSKMTSQSDDRFGSSAASRQGNLMQYQSSPRAGSPSPPQK